MMMMTAPTASTAYEVARIDVYVWQQIVVVICGGHAEVVVVVVAASTGCCLCLSDGCSR